MKDAIFYRQSTLRLGRRLFSLKRALVMGIINTTPDSFHRQSRQQSTDEIIRKAAQMIEEGADIIDIGGYSTRPGADFVSVQEETDRVVPAVETIIKYFPDTPVSADTFRASVAEAAVRAGASMVNDVSGGQADPDMFATVGKLGVAYVLMHMRGTPQTMQTLTLYNNLLTDMMDYFQERIKLLQAQGCNDIVIDPGFGFAKTLEQNHTLLHQLRYLCLLHKPILVGLSRKSMIYKKLDIGPEEALNGSTALHAIAITQGASILRVHDAKEAAQVVQLIQKNIVLNTNIT